MGKTKSILLKKMNRVTLVLEHLLAKNDIILSDSSISEI